MLALHGQVSFYHPQAQARTIAVHPGKLDTAAAAASDAPALIEMPESWVPRLTVTRDMLDMRVPKGSKKTVSRVSEHEIFALFGETSKFDGSLERLTVFTDEEHQVKLEVCLPIVAFIRQCEMEGPVLSGRCGTRYRDGWSVPLQASTFPM